MSTNPKIQNQLSGSQPISLMTKHKKCLERTSSQPIQPKDILKESQGNEITKNYNLSDDLDDSFDLFIPKRITKTMASTSTSSRSAKRKSPYFDEEDSDMKLAMELSMQENYKGTDRSSVIKKLCSVPPLLRRTQAEREKIITEKVAIILMDDKENKTEEPSSSNQVLSNSLQVQLDQNARLWKMSQQELINTNDFYISSIIKYENSGINIKNDVISEEIPVLESRIEDGSNISQHDVFQESYAQNNIECDNRDVPNSNLDINYFEMFQNSDEKDKTENPVIYDSNKSDSIDMTDLLDKVCHQIFKVDSDKKSVCSVSSSKTDNLYDEETLIGSPVPQTVDPQVTVDKWILKVKALKKLSEDMEKVWLYPDSYPITIICSDHTFTIQSSLLFSRCPLLYKEIRKHKLHWELHRFKECEPFFRYIITGNIDCFESLSSDSLFIILGLSKKYNLSILEDVISLNLKEIDLTIDLSQTKDLDENSYEMKINQQVKKNYMKKTQTNVPCYVVDSDDEDIKPVFEPELITIDSDSNISEPQENQILANFIANEFPFFTYLSTDIPEIIDLAKDQPRISPSYDVPKISLIPDSRTSYHDEYIQNTDDRKIDTSIAEILDENSDENNLVLDSNHLILNSNRQIFSTPGGRVVSVSEKATPKPDYQGMTSPELKKQLSNYGIKTNLGKRKGVRILNYIYDQLHPDRSNPATQAALNLCKSNIINQPSTSKKVLNFMTPKPVENLEYNSPQSSPKRPLQINFPRIISPRPSTSRDFLIGSSNLLETISSSSSDLYEIEKRTIESSDEETESANVFHLISPLVDIINSDFFLKRHILLHKPVCFDNMKTLLRERGVECNSKELKDGLKHLGITYKKQKSHKRKKQKKKSA